MIEFILMPLTGAFIGWLTNAIAIKSLFWPATPKRILFIKLHGLLPKRRVELATSIGQVVEKELVTTEALSQRLQAEGVKQRIVDEITAQVRVSLAEKLPRMLQQVTDLLVPITKRVIEPNLDGFLARAEDFVRDEAKIGEMVTERINGFDLGQLEKLVTDISGKELRHIERLGGVLGGIVGIIQAVMVQFI